MKRHLVSVDRAVGDLVRDHIAAKFAEDVIAGRVIHDIDSDVFCLREKATPEFIAAAEASYVRLIRQLGP